MSISVKELEDFFNKYQFQDVEIKLGEHETIADTEKFVMSHLQAIKSNSGNRTFLPYYNRLVKLYKILKVGDGLQRQF